MIPYKDDNPTSRFPIVTVALIVINILVFLVLRLQGAHAFRQAVIQAGVIPRELFLGNLQGSTALSPPVTLFTSMFMHGGVLHILGNMVYLWIFGNNVEDYLGHVRFALFYIACGLVAAFSHILINLNSGVPMVGASGAIAGVLGAYLVLYPWARVHVLVFVFFFITTFMVPAWLVLGFWFVLQVLYGLPSIGMAVGGTAYLAHIGGFLAGYLYIRRRAGKTGFPRRPRYARRRRMR